MHFGSTSVQAKHSEDRSFHPLLLSVISRIKRAEQMTHNVLDYETVVVCGLLTTPCPVRALLSSRAALSWQVRESSKSHLDPGLQGGDSLRTPD